MKKSTFSQLDFDRWPLLMGIVNVTPDSFSDGGNFDNVEAAVAHAMKLVADGADLLDVGGESTRPGAGTISVQEELDRVILVINGIRRQSSVPISVDTYKAEVAHQALVNGADLVNDIYGVEPDPELLRIVAEAGAGLVLMHIRGGPETMQANTDYDDLIGEIAAGLAQGRDQAVAAGVAKESIILDPGIGFGKSVEGNLEILRRLDELLDLGHPLLVGASRKSFIGKVLDRKVHEREWGTAATVAAAVSKGASIIRVHDVKAMKDVALMSKAIWQT